MYAHLDPHMSTWVQKFAQDQLGDRIDFFGRCVILDKTPELGISDASDDVAGTANYVPAPTFGMARRDNPEEA